MIERLKDIFTKPQVLWSLADELIVCILVLVGVAVIAVTFIVIISISHAKQKRKHKNRKRNVVRNNEDCKK